MKRRISLCRLISLWTISLTMACGPQLELEQRQQNILNGKVDTDPNHLAIVAIRGAKNGKSYTCTGTLVAPDAILTAGHCVEGVPSSALTILFGQSIANSTATYHPTQVILHPGFNIVRDAMGNVNEVYNDVALLRFQGLAPTASLPIAPLPAQLKITASDIGGELELVGYGRVSTSPYARFGTKLVTYSPIKKICTAPCALYFEGQQRTVLTQNVIVTDSGVGATCKGDSGGPALIRRGGASYVAGITSIVTCNDWSGFMQVDAFEDFIRDALD